MADPTSPSPSPAQAAESPFLSAASDPSTWQRAPQVTGQQFDQAEQSQRAAASKENTWGNFAERLGVSGHQYAEEASKLLPSGYPSDPNFSPPKLTDQVYDGLTDDQKTFTYAHANSSAEMQKMVTDALVQNHRQQQLLASSFGVRAFANVEGLNPVNAANLPYLPLAALPGFGEEVMGSRLTAFALNSIKGASEGTALAAVMSRNDPSSSGSDLAKGFVNMLVLGGVFHSVGLIPRGVDALRARFGRPDGPPEMQPGWDFGPSAPPTLPAHASEYGPAYQAQASEFGPAAPPTLHPAEVHVGFQPEDFIDQNAPTIYPKARAPREGVTIDGQSVVSASPWWNGRAASADVQVNLMRLERHLDVDRVLDAQDRGEPAAASENLDENTNRVVDAQREVQDMHADVAAKAAKADAISDRIVAKVAEEHIQRMEQTGEIPVRNEPGAQLERAYRDASEGSEGGKVPLTEVLKKLPEGADEAAVLKALEAHPKAELHAPEPPPEAVEGAPKVELPETVKVGDQEVHAVSMDIPSKGMLADELSRMRQDAAAAEHHSDLAKAIGDKQLAREMAKAQKEHADAARELKAREDFFAGRKAAVPESVREHVLTDTVTEADKVDGADTDVRPVRSVGDVQKDIDGIKAEMKAAKAELKKFPRRLEKKLGGLQAKLDDLKEDLKDANKAAKQSNEPIFDSRLSGADYPPAYGQQLREATKVLREAVTSHAGSAFKAHQVLDWVIHESPDGFMKSVLQRIRAAMPDMPVEVEKTHTFDVGGKQAGGVYSNTRSGLNDKIRIGHLQDIHVLAHEMVHAVTARFINANPDHPLVKDLEKLLAHVKGEFEKAEKAGRPLVPKGVGATYGLSNTKEFLSEGMTRTVFQEALAKISVPKDLFGAKGSAWKSLTGIVRKIVEQGKEALGFDGGYKDRLPAENNAWEHLLKSFEGVTREQKKWDSTLDKSPAGIAAGIAAHRARLSPYGQALKDAHETYDHEPSMPTDIRGYADEQDKRGDVVRWWQRGGQWNPFYTRVNMMTDVQKLGSVAATEGGDYVQPVAGSSGITTNRYTAGGIKKSMLDGAMNQLAKEGKYRQQWLAETNQSKLSNPFSYDVMKAWEADVYGALEGRQSSNAAKAFVNDVYRPLMKTFADRAKETGAEWAQHLDPSNYHPRVHDAVEQGKLKADFGGGQKGDEAMGQMWAESFRRWLTANGKNVPPQELLDAIGAGFQKRLVAVHGGWDHYIGHGVNLGDTDFMLKFLQQAGLPQAQLRRAIAALEGFHQKVEGGPTANTQTRLHLDMTMQVPHTDWQGKTIADLMDKRAIHNALRYTDSMSGAIGLASVKVFNESDHNAKLVRGIQDMKQRGTEQWRIDQWQDQMNGFYKDALGLPHDDQSYKGLKQLNSALRTLMGSARMGTSGVPIWGTNVSRNLGYGTLASTMKQLPEFGTYMKRLYDARGTELPKMLEDLSKVMIMDADRFSLKMWDGVLTDPDASTGERFNAGLTTFANRTAQLVHSKNPLGMSKAVAAGNMITALNTYSRIADNLRGARDDIGQKSWQWLGVNADMGKRILAEMEKASPGITASGVKPDMGINWGAMTDYEARDRLKMALNAYVNRRIHDEDWGAKAPWMESELGKIFMQLRTFVFEAGTKQLSAGMNMDRTEFASDMVLMSVGGALEFAARQYITAMQTPPGDQRDKLLKDAQDPGKWVTAAYARNPMFSMVPGIVDTVFNLFGEPGLAEGMRSTGQDQNIATGNPTMDTLTKLQSVAGDMGKQFSGKGAFTQRSWNNLEGITPAGNMIGSMALWKWTGHQLDLPAKPPRQPRGAKQRDQENLIERAVDDEE